jgi:transcription initiation factor TFIIIB Brf1 subunit/transcription initiation factor TFIIB
MPLRCPKCCATNICKEYYLGSQTGDYVCGGCGEVAWRSFFEKDEEPPAPKKTESTP